MLKKAINCINPNLISIYQKSINIDQISIRVLHHIPEHLQSSIKIASYEKGTLTLAFNNTAIANELRYLVPELRSALRQKENMHQLTQIKLVQKR